MPEVGTQFGPKKGLICHVLIISVSIGETVLAPKVSGQNQAKYDAALALREPFQIGDPLLVVP
jgi:hypothetical protein